MYPITTNLLEIFLGSCAITAAAFYNGFVYGRRRGRLERISERTKARVERDTDAVIRHTPKR